MKKHSFLKVLFSVCTGIGIFVDIAVFPLYRTVLHFILLGLLSSILCAFLAMPSVKEKINTVSNAFEQEFGEVVISGREIAPSKEANKTRSIVVGGISIDYVADAGNPPSFTPSAGTSNGLLWLPNSAVIWTKGNGDKYDYLPAESMTGHAIAICTFFFFSYNYIPLGETTGYGGTTLTGDAMHIYKTAKSTAFPEIFITVLKDIFPADKISPSNTQILITVFCAMGIFATTALKIFFFVPLFALFASVFYSISGPELVFPSKYRNIVNIAMYASYPGVIIATLASGLRINYIDFQTICAFAFLIYFTYLLGKYQKRDKTQTETADYEEF